MSWRRHSGDWFTDIFRAAISICWLTIALMFGVFSVWLTFHALSLLARVIGEHVFGLGPAGAHR